MYPPKAQQHAVRGSGRYLLSAREQLRAELREQLEREPTDEEIYDAGHPPIVNAMYRSFQINPGTSRRAIHLSGHIENRSSIPHHYLTTSRSRSRNRYRFRFRYRWFGGRPPRALYARAYFPTTVYYATYYHVSGIYSGRPSVSASEEGAEPAVPHNYCMCPGN